MSIPDYQSLMLPVLKAASEGEVRIGSVVEELANQSSLTPDERLVLLPSGGQTLFSNRVKWAKTYLSQAGLIENTRRGHFRITTRGHEVLSTNPSRIDNILLNQFQEFREFKQRGRPVEQGNENSTPRELKESTIETETPDETMRRAQKQVHALLASELLHRIRTAPPDFFERLIIVLLVNMGYGDANAEKAGRTLGRSGDDGVDGVVDQDSLGLDRVYVQAKRYAEGNNVGSGAIRDFFGSLDRHKATKGLFVTTSAFSASARETAELLSKRIVLIDGEQLAGLMIRHNVGCRVEDTFEIKNLDDEFFEPS